MTRLAVLAVTLLVALGGSASAGTSDPLPPINTVPPVITGTASEGQTLTVSTGTWTSLATITFSYKWYRCGYAGAACTIVDGATSATYTLTEDDAGRTLRAVVVAVDANGENSATAAPTAMVIGLAPPETVVNAEELPTAIRIEDVVEPNGIAVDEVAFVPTALKTRRPFKLRVHVVDGAKLDVVGAFATVTDVPGGLVDEADGVVTDDEGWAMLTLKPSKAFVLKRGSLALLVNVRVAGDDLLTGPSTHRLVRVQVVPPKAKASPKRAAAKKSQ